MSVLEELAGSARTVSERVAGSVVRVGRGGGRGCGVIVGENRVVTNAHNLRGHEITVTFDDGREAVGRLAGVDVDGDVAVVEVDTGDGSPITWATSDAATGDVVFAVSRGVLGGTRVTFGLVSATERTFRGPRGRRITGSLEHTAPLPRGSSGSPVVDAEGRLLGLNTNRLGDGFYLALAADDSLRTRIAALASGESRATPRLGIGIAPTHIAKKLRRAVGLPERDGLLVRVVEEDGPAARAGVRQGDLIVEAGHRPARTIDDLFAALDAVASTATGSSAGLDLKVVRGTDELDLRITFGNGTKEEGAA